MKLKIVALVILLASMAACTQRTCPTYTKDSVEKMEKPEKSV